MSLNERMPQRQNDEKGRSWDSDNESLQGLIETMQGLDAAELNTLLKRMKSMADSMRSMRCQVNKKDACVPLSDRESEVLIMISHGYTRREVGHSLGISTNTASRHISNIYTKLGISCVAEATAFAFQHNLTAAGVQQ